MERTLTEQEFIDAAKQFLELSQKIGDTWELIQPEASPPYLRKALKQTLAVADSTSRTADDDDFSETIEELVVDDPSSEIPAKKETDLYQFEYHVLYSVSYQVPILFFNVNKSDGTLLRLEEAWSGFRELAAESREQLKQTLTQMEHPVLFRPFLALHPCQTARVLGNVPASGNPLVAFVSSYGPVVGLNLDIRYASLGK